MNPDYVERGTLSDINKELSANLKPGWNEGKTDTALVLPCESLKDGQGSATDQPWYTAQIWNRCGIRSELANLLALPVWSET